MIILIDLEHADFWLVAFVISYLSWTLKIKQTC